MAVIDLSTFLTGILSGFLVVVLYQVIKFYKDLAKYPPGPTPLPIIGNILLFRQQKHIHDIVVDLKPKYGNIITIWFGHTPQVFVLDSNETLNLLKSKSFSGRPVFSFLDDILSKPGSNIIAFGDFSRAWEVLRRVAYAAVRRYAVSPVLPEHVVHVVDPAVDKMLAQMKSNEEIDMGTYLTTVMISLLSTSAFGKKFKEGDRFLKEMTDAVIAFEKEANIFVLVGLNPIFKYIFWNRMTKIFKLNRIIMNNVAVEYEEHEKSYDPTDNTSKDFIDALMWAASEADQEAVKYLDRWSCQNVILDLFFAGSETTRTTLRWLFLILCLEPEMQSKIREEVEAVLDHDSEIPSLDDRDKCPFTSAFILEVLRFRSLLPFALPHKAVEDTQILGYTIPAGTTILPSLIHNHSENDHWADADKFNPYRFLEKKENEDEFKVNTRPNPHFVPFSTGRRSCIGEKLALANLFLITTRIIQRTKGLKFEVDLKPGDSKESLLSGDIYKTDFFGPIFYKIRLTKQ